MVAYAFPPSGAASSCPWFGMGEIMDLFDLSGKTAVVTGGSRGIGLMIARGLLEAGARVYISSRKVDACAAAERELTQYGKVVAIPADLSTEAECLRLAEEVGQRESALHVLVNNAGATWARRWRSSPPLPGTR